MYHNGYAIFPLMIGCQRGDDKHFCNFNNIVHIRRTITRLHHSMRLFEGESGRVSRLLKRAKHLAHRSIPQFHFTPSAIRCVHKWRDDWLWLVHSGPTIRDQVASLLLSANDSVEMLRWLTPQSIANLIRRENLVLFLNRSPEVISAELNTQQPQQQRFV